MKNITTISIKLDKHIVWNMCVEHEFYTCGDNEEYEAMFNMIENGADVDTIAEDIAQHSEIEHDHPAEYVKKCLIVSHVKAWAFDMDTK